MIIFRGVRPKSNAAQGRSSPGLYNRTAMIVEIPDHVLAAADVSSKELLLKIALLLFQEERLTLGQASKLAGVHQFEFQKELSARDIPIHYREEDFERDLKTLGLKR